MDIPIWAARPFCDDKVYFEHMGIRHWKWILYIHISFRLSGKYWWSGPWLCVGLHWNNFMRADGYSPPDTWRLNHAHHHYELRPFHWRAGFESMYYDGNWNSLAVGPVWVNWWS